MSKRSLISIFVILLVTAITVGAVFYLKAFRTPQAVEAADQHAGHETTDRVVVYWYDSMNPDYKSDKPGNAPDGMKLVPMYQDEIETVCTRSAT